MDKKYGTKAGTVLVAVILVVCIVISIAICITIATVKKTDNVMSVRTPVPTSAPTAAPVREPSEQVDDAIGVLLTESDFYALPVDEKVEKAGALLAEMEEDGLVSECEYDEGQQQYYFTYADGTWGTIELEKRSEMTNGTFDTGLYNPKCYDITDRLVYDEPCDIVVLNAFENTPYRREFYDEAIDNWSSHSALGVQYDTEVTVEDMRHLSGNSVVVFSMHGTVIRHIPALVLNEAPSAETDELYADDMKAHRVAKAIGETGAEYIILPSFFENVYGRDDLKGMLFFSESCDFFGDDGSSAELNASFADALILSSAEGVIGFRNSVRADYSRNLMETIVSSVCKGEMIGNAWNAALQTYGSNDGNGAYPVIIFGDTDLVPDDTEPEPTEATLLPTDIYNGQIFKLPEYVCDCPLTVSVRGTDGYYIYLEYSNPPEYSYTDREPDSGNEGDGEDLSFYIAPGETVEVNVPIGDYRLFYCCGETWYGIEHKFGVGTSYYTSDSLLDFYTDIDGDWVVSNGHTLELWAREGGNMHSEPIDAGSFPE